MQDPVAKAKFNSSRLHLSNALKNLEKIIKNKLEKNYIDNTTLNLQDNFEEAEIKIHQQKLQISDLTREIHDLQKTLNEVSKENELLHSRINGSAEMKQKFCKESNDLIQSLNSKLKQIDEIITKL